jgi:hypothetical protein
MTNTTFNTVLFYTSPLQAITIVYTMLLYTCALQMIIADLHTLLLQVCIQATDNMLLQIHH